MSSVPPFRNNNYIQNSKNALFVNPVLESTKQTAKDVLSNINFIEKRQKAKQAQENYILSLQEECLTLERQLRQARDELRFVRQRCQKLQSETTRQAASAVVAAKEHEAVLKENFQQYEALQQLLQQIEQLETQTIPDLEQVKQELEEQLNSEIERTEEIKRQLHISEDELVSCKTEYEQQIQQIESEYNDKIDLELENLRQTLQEQMEIEIEDLSRKSALEQEEAVQKAVQAVREEYEEHLERERNAFQQEMEALHQEAEDLLEEERQKCKLAVDREKRKMKRLVKALAIREQKILQYQEENSKNGADQLNNNQVDGFSTPSSFASSQEATPLKAEAINIRNNPMDRQ